MSLRVKGPTNWRIEEAESPASMTTRYAPICVIRTQRPRVEELVKRRTMGTVKSEKMVADPKRIYEVAKVRKNLPVRVADENKNVSRLCLFMVRTKRNPVSGHWNKIIIIKFT
jgi:hypothetical protein